MVEATDQELLLITIETGQPAQHLYSKCAQGADQEEAAWREIEKPKERAPATAINLMDALRKSVAADRRDSRRVTRRAATHRERASANRSRVRTREAS